MSNTASSWLACALAGVALLAGSAAQARGGGAGGGGGGFGHAGPEERLERLDDAFATDEYDTIRRLQQRGDILPLEKILDRARRQRQGRVLETELERKHDRYIYEVEILDDKGHVWEMKLDAATGEVLKNRQED